MAYIAYHFNWSREEIMKMPHWERRRWIKEISGINSRINKSVEAMQTPAEGANKLPGGMIPGMPGMR